MGLASGSGWPSSLVNPLPPLEGTFSLTACVRSRLLPMEQWGGLMSPAPGGASGCWCCLTLGQQNLLQTLGAWAWLVGRGRDRCAHRH